jgi:hypothetical protein
LLFIILGVPNQALLSALQKMGAKPAPLAIYQEDENTSSVECC